VVAPSRAASAESARTRAVPPPALRLLQPLRVLNAGHLQRALSFFHSISVAAPTLITATPQLI